MPRRKSGDQEIFEDSLGCQSEETKAAGNPLFTQSYANSAFSIAWDRRLGMTI
jgi:hypothetical protein